MIVLPAKTTMKNVPIAKGIIQSVMSVKNMEAIVKVAVLVAVSIVKNKKYHNEKKDNLQKNSHEGPGKKQGFFIIIDRMAKR